MQLVLEKPLVFLDLETTGLNLIHDRIVEISLLKIFPDNKEKCLTFRVNPLIPIPKEATLIHGITDKDIADKPTFNDIADKIISFLIDTDLAGFNILRFDVPLLAEELIRIEKNFDFKQPNIIDVQNIFHKMEKRTLQAAYKFYCNKDLIDAHSAEVDTRATFEVLKAQITKYEDIENNTPFLAKFSANHEFIDLAGFIVQKDKKTVFTFGKYKNISIEKLIKENPGYINWILRSDFPAYTKKIIQKMKSQLPQ